MNENKTSRNSPTNPFPMLAVGQTAIWVADPFTTPSHPEWLGQDVEVLAGYAPDDRGRRAYWVRFEDGSEADFVCREKLYVPGDTGHDWRLLRQGLAASARRRARKRCVFAADGRLAEYVPAVGESQAYEHLRGQKVIIPAGVPVWLCVHEPTALPPSLGGLHLPDAISHISVNEIVVTVDYVFKGHEIISLDNSKRTVKKDPLICWPGGELWVYTPADLVLVRPAIPWGVQLEEFSRVVF